MRIRSVALALTLSLVAAAAAQDAAKVESFSPQGQIKDVQQVVVRFSQPIVSFGDPRSEAPFEVACAGAMGAGPPQTQRVPPRGANTLAGRGRWADARNWLYDFDQDLPAGIECNFKTKGGLKSFAGAEVAAQTFRFSTGGPSIRNLGGGSGAEPVIAHTVFDRALFRAGETGSMKSTRITTISMPTAEATTRIVSPADGTVIAPDPDIPAARQSMLVRADAPQATRVCLKLGAALVAPCGMRKAMVKLPAPGRHQIRLETTDGTLLAQASIEVRGVPR